MFLDPQLEQHLATFPTIDLSDLSQARAEDDAFRAGQHRPDEHDLAVRDIAIRRDEEPDVPIRTYATREQARASGAVLWIHGGGWAIGGLHTDDERCREIARRTGAVVVSVDYRLAPDSPFPAALKDCREALAWIHRHSSELLVDKGHVVVAGASAGANLAAALTLLAHDEGLLPISFQFLAVPALDDRAATDSAPGAPGLRREHMDTFWRWYLDGEQPDDFGYAAPARRDSLVGLPRAYVSVAENDPLRDEGIAYATRLMQSGVSVELHTFPGAFHGSSLLRDCDVSARQAEEMVAVLARETAVGDNPR